MNNAFLTNLKNLWHDSRRGLWVERTLPDAMQPYARLIRLDHPIGTWLLLLPCWWGVALASQDGLPNLVYIFLFALGAVIMRGAGCIVNDIVDRRLDALVERTKTRPLASGEIKLWQALIFFLILLALGLSLLLFFNRLTVYLGVASLALVFTYPLMKRFTWWPQLFLGFTFNWGLLLGTTAVLNTMTATALFFYAGGVFWTLAYDTIYAHQDKQDDARVGILSTARLFGDHSKPWVALFYAISFIFMLMGASVNGLGRGFVAALAAAALYTSFQVYRWQPDIPSDCLKRFRANREIGFLILVAILVGKIT